MVLFFFLILASPLIFSVFMNGKQVRSRCHKLMPFRLAEGKHPFLESQLYNHYKETNNFILVFDWLDGTFSFRVCLNES